MPDDNDSVSTEWSIATQEVWVPTKPVLSSDDEESSFEMLDLDGVSFDDILPSSTPTRVANSFQEKHFLVSPTEAPLAPMKVKKRRKEKPPPPSLTPEDRLPVASRVGRRKASKNKRYEVEEGSGTIVLLDDDEDDSEKATKEIGSRVFCKFTNGRYYWGNITKKFRNDDSDHFHFAVEYQDGDYLSDISDNSENETRAHKNIYTELEFKRILKEEPPPKPVTWTPQELVRQRQQQASCKGDTLPSVVCRRW